MKRRRGGKQQNNSADSVRHALRVPQHKAARKRRGKRRHTPPQPPPQQAHPGVAATHIKFDSVGSALESDSDSQSGSSDDGGRAVQDMVIDVASQQQQQQQGEPNPIDNAAWHTALPAPPFPPLLLTSIQLLLDSYDAVFSATATSSRRPTMLFQHHLTELMMAHYPRRNGYLIDYAWLLWGLRKRRNAAAVAACLVQWHLRKQCAFDENVFPYAAILALFKSAATTKGSTSSDPQSERGAALFGANVLGMEEARLRLFDELIKLVSLLPHALLTRIMAVSSHALRETMLQHLADRACYHGDVSKDERSTILRTILDLRALSPNMVLVSAPALLRMYASPHYFDTLPTHKEAGVQICQYFAYSPLISGSRFIVEHQLFPRYTSNQLLTLLRQLRKFSGHTRWVVHFLEPIIDTLTAQPQQAAATAEHAADHNASSNGSSSNVVADAFRFIAREPDLCESILKELAQTGSGLHRALLGALSALQAADAEPYVLSVWEGVWRDMVRQQSLVLLLLRVDMKGNVHWRRFICRVLGHYIAAMTSPSSSAEAAERPRTPSDSGSTALGFDSAIASAVQTVLDNGFPAPWALFSLLAGTETPQVQPFVFVLEKLAQTPMQGAAATSDGGAKSHQPTLSVTSHITAIFDALGGCLAADTQDLSGVAERQHVQMVISRTVYQSRVFRQIAYILYILPHTQSALTQLILHVLDDIPLLPDARPLSPQAIQSLIRAMAHPAIDISEHIASLFNRLVLRDAPGMPVIKENIVRGFFGSFDYHFSPQLFAEPIVLGKRLNRARRRGKPQLANEYTSQDAKDAKHERLRHLTSAFADIANDLDIKLGISDLYREELLKRVSLPTAAASAKTSGNSPVASLPNPYILYLVTLTHDELAFVSLHGVQLAHELSQLPPPSAPAAEQTAAATDSIPRHWLDTVLSHLYQLVPPAFDVVLLLPLLNSLFFASTTATRDLFLTFLERVQPVNVSAQHSAMFSLLIQILVETERRSRHGQLQDAIWWCAVEGLLRQKFMHS
ncbi:hypothetical protein RI367_000250 [Sorochytrium milnesiophthora]